MSPSADPSGILAPAAHSIAKGVPANGGSVGLWRPDTRHGHARTLARAKHPPAHMARWLDAPCPRVSGYIILWERPQKFSDTTTQYVVVPMLPCSHGDFKTFQVERRRVYWISTNNADPLQRQHDVFTCQGANGAELKSLTKKYGDFTQKLAS